MKLLSKFSFVFLIFAICGLSEIRAQRGGQTSFGMETKIKKTYRIPRYAVEQIIKNDEYFSMADIDSLSERLEGSLVNLNNDSKPDLFVQGDDGANITGFWLFRSVGGKWKLILSSRAAWLQIDKAMTKGFYNVQIQAASAVTMWGSTYKFNGVKYIPGSCWEADMSKQKEKRNYFQCSGSSVKPYR